jgi:hypothetical protein
MDANIDRGGWLRAVPLWGPTASTGNAPNPRALVLSGWRCRLRPAVSR